MTANVVRTIKQGALLLSAATIVVVAALYGIWPAWFAREVLGVTAMTPSLADLLRALMCLYLAFAAFWVYAAFDGRYRNPALLTVVLFPAGLVVGRILSVGLDGRPSGLLTFYLVAELVQAPLAYWVFRLEE
jgi:hypothetical protein